MRTFSNPRCFPALLALLALALPLAGALAQQGVGPQAESEEPPPPPHFPDRGDADVNALAEALIGMHQGDDQVLYVQRVELPDAAPALYVELVMIGEENEPRRQQIWVPHKRDGVLRVRACELPMGMRDLVVGMWAAPQLYPPARLDQYGMLADLDVEGSGERYELRSAGAAPIARDGAIEYELNVERTEDGVSWADAGTSLTGEEVFALEATMKRRPRMPSARELEDGILVYDLRKGFGGPEPKEGDSIAVQFSEWSMDGFLIDTTRQDMRGIHFFRIGQGRMSLPSWEIGAVGLREGGIRRIYDPASESGMLQGKVTQFRQPQAIITEFECVSIKDNTPE